MKKFICGLAALLLAGTLALPTFAYEYWNEEVSVTAAYGTPTIDGKTASGEWDAAPEIKVPLTGDPLEEEGYALYQGEWSGDRNNSDFSASYKLMWDENNLYILEVRKDNVVNLYGDASEPWTTDGTLVFLMPVDDSSSAGTVNPDGVHHHIFYIAGNGDGNVGGDMRDRVGDMTSGTQSVMDVEGGKISSTTTSDGFIVEVAVPWTQLADGLTDFKGAAADMKLGFSLVIHDSDESDGTTGFVKQICWGYITENLPVNGYDFGGWGVMTLAGKPEAPAVEEAPATEAPAETTTSGTVAPATADAASLAVFAACVAAAGAFIVARKKK